jgi:hypothetical protein
LRVDPETDLDSTCVGFWHDEQEMIRINGWLWSFEPVGRADAH